MIIPELDHALGQLHNIAVLIEVKLHHSEISDDIRKIADRLNEVLNAIV